MSHPDMKSLLWGRHLQRLLAAWGKPALPSEPQPRIARNIPVWYQRLGAVLTILGLVGGLRLLDRAIQRRPSPEAEQAAVSPIVAGSWNNWAQAIHRGLDPLTWESAEPARLDTVSLAPGTTPAGSAAHPAKAPDPHRFQKIDVTAYSTGGAADPTRTASSLPPAAGTIALSRDLLRTFNPGAPFDFGDKVLIPGVGVFEVRDTMNPRWSSKADLWFSSPAQARAWGNRAVFVTRVGGNAPTIAYQVR